MCFLYILDMCFVLVQIFLSLTGTVAAHPSIAVGAGIYNHNGMGHVREQRVVDGLDSLPEGELQLPEATNGSA